MGNQAGIIIRNVKNELFHSAKRLILNEVKGIECLQYNQTENPYIPEPPVNTGALVYCYRDWMLTFVSNDDHVKIECLRVNTRRVVHNLGLDIFASALMWVVCKVFGLGVINMPWVPNEKEGKFLLDEIMQAGNFGHQDMRFNINGIGSHAMRYYLTVKSKVRFIRHYPIEVLWQPVSMVILFFKLRWLRMNMKSLK